MVLLPFQATWLPLPRRPSESLLRLAISSPRQRLARPTIALVLAEIPNPNSKFISPMLPNMLLPPYKTQWLPLLRGTSGMVLCLPLFAPVATSRPADNAPAAPDLPPLDNQDTTSPPVEPGVGGLEGVDSEGEGVQDAGDMEGDIMEQPNSDSIDSSGEEEEEEIDDLSISYLDEQSNIEATGLGAEQKYRDYLSKNDTTTTHFPILRAMATGLSDSDRLDCKFEACVSKGWLSKKQVNITKDLLKDELSRRFELAKQCEEDGLPKRIKLTGSAQQLVQRMGVRWRHEDERPPQDEAGSR